MPIRVLPESLVNKIAAGEVIVRPASVVKELVENALDAGATRISVEVSEGCRDIRVSDDGRGMARADATLALVRHATSKIESFDDLYRLDTRGFRGEALASIASVSRTTILTRRRGDVAGCRISAEGAGEPRVEPAGCPEGTDVRVRELFYNTPARLKFLKRPSTELQYILATVTRQALLRPETGFRVENAGVMLLDLPPAQPWPARIGALLGHGVEEHLLSIDMERAGVRVTGYIARPAASRNDRRQQHFHVHGRPIVSKSLGFVLHEAYKGVIMVGRFPVCVLNLTLPAGDVDVNVHPTKEEVRFRDEGLVNGLVHRAAFAGLQSANLIPVVTFDGAGEASAAAGETTGGRNGSDIPWPAGGPSGGQQAGLGHPGHMQPDVLGAAATDGLWRGISAGASPRGMDAGPAGSVADFSRYTASSVPADDGGLAAAGVMLAAMTAAASGVPPVHAPVPLDEGHAEGSNCGVRPLNNSIRGIAEAAPGTADATAGGTPWAHLLRGGQLPRPLGQVARCYIVAQAGDDLLLIDQHAAHERLMYLRFTDAPRAAPSQPLLIPVSLDVPAQALAYMHRLLPVFEALGLKVEPFGGSTFVVQAVPADLPKMDPASVIADLLDDFESLGRVERIEVLRDRIVTRMACRAAVKAGQTMHHEEMEALIRDLAEARLGFTCPHGRPTMVLLTRDQLDRQFKRVV